MADTGPVLAVGNRPNTISDKHAEPGGMTDPGRRLSAESRSGKRYLLLAVAAGLHAALATLAFLYLLSVVISQVFIGGQTLQESLPTLAVMIGLLAARMLVLALQERLAQAASSAYKWAVRERLLVHLQRLGPTYTLGQRGGELINTAVAGVEALDGWVTRYQPARLLAMIVPAVVVLIILWLDPWSTLVLLFAGPVLILLLVFIGQRTQALTERRFADLSWMSAYFLDMLRGLPTMKAYGRSREQADNIAEISAQFGRTTMEVLRTAFQSSLVLEWGATAAAALVAVEVSLRLMADLMPFSTALAVLLLTPEFFLPLRQLALQYHAGSEGKAAASRIYAILDTPMSQVHDPTNSDRLETVRMGTILFRDVGVLYDNERQPALRDVSLRIPEGQTVALVGPTGAGKSTIANLLLRFIEPTTGAILVGDTPLARVDPVAWRRQIAWVPQKPHLFAGSIADNIRIANSEAGDAAVQAAAEAANAHEFIMDLPQGYATIVGDEGMRLSGGQRQRVAIARALLKNAPLVILDEATAHLDAASEAAVWEALERLMDRRTVLIIAHRLQLARRADLIAVLDGGRVVASGTHQSLLVESELYRQLTASYLEQPA